MNLNRFCAGGSETAPGAAVAVPRYDKSAHAGRGDRAPPGKWPRVKGPVELVRPIVADGLCSFRVWVRGVATARRPAGGRASRALSSWLGPVLQVLGFWS